MTLNNAIKNKNYIVESINYSDKLYERIITMGIVVNFEIKVVEKSIFNDPLLININNSYIAISKYIANMINIKEKE